MNNPCQNCEYKTDMENIWFLQMVWLLDRIKSLEDKIDDLDEKIKGIFK